MKTFNRMTAAQKRVAIAKDVINQIKNGGMIPYTGIYFLWLNNTNANLGENFNQKSLTDKNNKCKVCGIGAAIVSGIRLFNKLELSPNFGDGDSALKVIKNWFTVSQTVAIECAFEDESTRLLSKRFTNKKLNNKAIKFGEKYFSPEEKAIAIYKNIIKNKGVFKP